MWRRARSSASSARTVRARRHSSMCCPASIRRRRAAFASPSMLNIARLPPHRVTRCGIARTFQNQRLFNQMTVLENVLAGMVSRTRAGLLSIMLALPGARAEKAAANSVRWNCWAVRVAARAAEGSPGVLAVLRQPAAPGDRPRTRDRPATAAAGRTGRRHEPERDARTDGRHPAHPRHAA